jgi:hypothetical protein
VPSAIESLRNDVAKSLSNLFESNGIHAQIGFAVVMTAVRVVPDDVVGPAVSDRRRVSPRWGGVASPAPGRDRRSRPGRAFRGPSCDATCCSWAEARPSIPATTSSCARGLRSSSRVCPRGRVRSTDGSPFRRARPGRDRCRRRDKTLMQIVRPRGDGCR